MSDELLVIIGALIGLGLGAIFLYFYHRNRY